MNEAKAPVSRWLGLGLAVLSSAMVFASGEPLGWGPLAWVAPIPLLVAVVRVEKARWAALYGFVFGVAYFAVELYWIFLFGWMAWTGLTIFMALYSALSMYVAGRVKRFGLAPLFVAGAWTGGELLRDRQPFGGYSWGSLGTTQGSVPGVRWLAGTVGAYGLCFLVVFVAALVACRFATGRTSVMSFVIVATVLSVAVWADLAMFGQRPTSRTIDLAVIQGNVPRPVVVGQRDAILNNHIGLTEDLIERDPAPSGGRVVVWPEDSIGVGVSPGAFEQVADLAGRTATPFLVGRSVLEGPDQAFKNLVEHIDSTGEPVDRYQKRHPVPFGEYVPVSFLRRFVGTLQAEIPSDLQRGTRANVFDIDGAKIATPICFESVFPRDFLDFARNGAEAYVLSTNNASFGTSYASEQHLAHTRMRALETRQWVVQAALSGISASIAPDGEITNQTKMFEPATFQTTIGLRKAHSLYAKTGDVFAELFALLALAATLVAMRRESR